MVKCVGTSKLVRDSEATFFTKLDNIIPLRPDDTEFVVDQSPHFRSSRLYLEAVLRKTPLPVTEAGLALAGRQLLQPMEYQYRAASKALEGIRPRLLIADAVGLGKTLEVGLILSELIRRGRGDRILVVTPRHILEQFQHELWTRFAIPLVRLDSDGIARVKREIPANRNPFTHYKRVIISIDTLKNAGRYRHHLEGIRWDAVVIDECHNLVNRGTLNNQLARVLAPRTDALLLTSATPHNGDPKSFAELINLLDPTAVADPENIRAEQIEHLYVRRHKHSDDVAAEVWADWAERLEPRALRIPASAAENALFAELSETWLHPPSGSAPTSGAGRSLFPWTLFKAALSSHKALADTIANRRRTLAQRARHDQPDVPNPELPPELQAEDNALATLADRCNNINERSASKLVALIDNLREIGIGPASGTRVVVFSERIATLNWLAEQVPKQLGLKPNQVRVLHGGMADVKQMDVIEEFGLADSPVRLLLTGDMASEGVNLHSQCHHLIHFDLPWSLITIEQRNGRIDRFGQQQRPDIRALLLVPADDQLDGDLHVIAKLLEREHQAHRTFGDSGSLLGLHDPAAEEVAVTKALAAGTDPDDAIPAEPDDDFDLLALLTGGVGTDPVATYASPTLFDSDWDFAQEALAAAYDDPAGSLNLRFDPDQDQFLSLQPPRDLVSRLRVLPQSYLAEQGVASRLKITADPQLAQQRLDQARQSTDSTWPEVGHLAPLHPYLDWLTDKVLLAHGRNQAPVIAAEVDRPWLAIQGIFANGRGQPQLVEWLAVARADNGGQPDTMIRPLFDVLAEAGVSSKMPNPGRPFDVGPLNDFLPSALSAVRLELEARRRRHDTALDVALDAPTKRMESWVAASEQLALGLSGSAGQERRERTQMVREDTTALIESMRTRDEPLIRVLAAIVPRSAA